MRAATNRQRVSAKEPSEEPDDSSSSKAHEENENESCDEEQEEEEKEEEDVFANIAKPDFGITESFLKYLDNVVEIIKGDYMKEWDTWCVAKAYTHHAWDEYGDDWVEKTHKRLTYLEHNKGVSSNIAERIAAIETRMDYQEQGVRELSFLKGKYEELHRNYQNLQRENDEKTERINFLELQLMAGTTPDEPANTPDSDLANVMSDLGLDYPSD
ncbi:hypothetical protein CYMTET_25632 [Cymbomonas tetramitiformis]|uniref:Uncharacterized protein n=1 Tax=Cymbomonas tetramitiformis TaxID=36881 RepID=A0AAE0EWW4_9CHLO|nr:hypothetical protein CYMTET_46624 [Cymbomonas tetramitiformis]KAK3265709.1 hypothetical protein CYMTET_25632 [Cymbomonas tetramitiformis]